MKLIMEGWRRFKNQTIKEFGDTGRLRSTSGISKRIKREKENVTIYIQNHIPNKLHLRLRNLSSLARGENKEGPIGQFVAIADQQCESDTLGIDLNNPFECHSHVDAAHVPSQDRAIGKGVDYNCTPYGWPLRNEPDPNWDPCPSKDRKILLPPGLYELTVMGTHKAGLFDSRRYKEKRWPTSDSEKLIPLTQLRMDLRNSVGPENAKNLKISYEVTSRVISDSEAGIQYPDGYAPDGVEVNKEFFEARVKAWLVDN